MAQDKIKLLSNITEDSECNFFIDRVTFFDNHIGPVKPNRHTFYELMFVLEGEGTHYIDFQAYTIEKGTLFLISPTQVHYWEIINTLELYILRFDESIFFDTSFLKKCTVIELANILLLRGKDYRRAEIMLEALHEEFNGKKYLSKEATAYLLKLFLIELQRLLPFRDTAQKESDSFGVLNHLLHKNRYKIAKSSVYAKEMKLSTKQLNIIIKKMSGMNCGSYIRFKTLLEAKRLLIYTNLSSSEISYQLGFIDAAYFSRFFKRESGLSPRDFKKCYL